MLMIDGFGTNDVILTVFMFGATTLFGLVRAHRYPNQDQLTRWMSDHGLNPDASTRRNIAAYLKRTRWIRTVGFLAGFNVPFVWMWITRSAYRVNEVSNYWWVVGFGIGILLAEIVRPQPHGLATAAEPRRLAQYLPDFTRFDRWILVGLAVLLTLASIALPVKGIVSPNEASIPRNDVVWYLGMSAVTIVVIVITRLAQELIVRRRQSFDDLHEVQADDAMRSASIQGLAGLGYGAPMWICAAMAWDLQVTSQRPFTWILAPAMFLLMAGGLGMLLGFPRLQTRWTVPRAREA